MSRDALLNAKKFRSSFDENLLLSPKSPMVDTHKLSNEDIMEGMSYGKTLDSDGSYELHNVDDSGSDDGKTDVSETVQTKRRKSGFRDGRNKGRLGNDMNYLDNKVKNDIFQGEDSTLDQEIDLDDEIFKNLISKIRLSNDKYCHICKTEFNLLKRNKKNCKFCGNAICPSCSKKKRPDPNNPNSGNYYRICDLCESKYIARRIYLQNKEKIQTYEKEKNERVADLEKSDQFIREKKRLNENLLDERRRREKVYAANVDEISSEISKIGDEIRKIEIENKKVNDEALIMHKEVEETEYKLEEGRKSLGIEQYKLTEMKKRLDAIDLDLFKLGNVVSLLQKEHEQKNSKSNTKPTKSNNSSSKLSAYSDNRSTSDINLYKGNVGDDSNNFISETNSTNKEKYYSQNNSITNYNFTPRNGKQKLTDQTAKDPGSCNVNI